MKQPSRLQVDARMKDYPSLQGDFFVYSDIFSEGRPAYWSGYYTTRPYIKILDRCVLCLALCDRRVNLYSLTLFKFYFFYVPISVIFLKEVLLTVKPVPP